MGCNAMSRVMESVYDGKVASELTKKELIDAITRESRIKVMKGELLLANAFDWCMENAFREGFLSGEEFAKNYYKE